MKPKMIMLVIAAALLALDTQAQSTFQNLGFESANLPDVPRGQYGGMVNIVNALPGWNAYLGSIQTTQISHNGISLGSAAISILGPSYYPNDIIQGSYTVALSAGVYEPFPGNITFVSASIGQTGLIPASANSIQFRVAPYAQGVLVAWGTQSLSPILIEVSNNYSLYGVDVSAFSGESSELRFSAASLSNNRFNTFTLDSIVFSTQPVPEPNIFVLIGIGAILIGTYCQRKFLMK